MKTESIQRITFSQECPTNILIRSCNKWAVIVLYLLNENGVLRFNELEKIISEISPKVLTSTLRVLEEDGLIIRKIYPQVPPKVEYSITQKGRIFFEKLTEFLCWTQDEIYSQ